MHIITNWGVVHNINTQAEREAVMNLDCFAIPVPVFGDDGGFLPFEFVRGYVIPERDVKFEDPPFGY